MAAMYEGHDNMVKRFSSLRLSEYLITRKGVLLIRAVVYQPNRKKLFKSGKFVKV